MRGWLDRLTLQGRVTNSFSGSFTQYRDSKSFAPGQVTGFSIRSQNSDPLLWDITDPLNVKQIRYSRTGENISFKCTTDTLRTFAGFIPANAGSPVIKISSGSQPGFTCFCLSRYDNYYPSPVHKIC